MKASFGLFIPLGNQKGQEQLMSTIADLTTALQAEATAVSQLTTAVNALITAYQTAKGNAATVLSSADQAALDAAVADVQSQTTALAGEASSATAAVTPPPATTATPGA